MSAEQRLIERNLELPPPSEPKGVYASLVVVGSFAYTAGHLPIRADGSIVTGRVGEDLSAEQGYEAARLATLGVLATIRARLGSIDQIVRVVKVLGFVQCSADFTEQPSVINGASELLADVFGPDRGVAARSAVGASALPLGAAVEVEAVVQLVEAIE